MDTPEKVYALIKSFGEGNNLVSEEIKNLTKDNVAFHLQKYRKKLRSIAKKDGSAQNPILCDNEIETNSLKAKSQSLPYPSVPSPTFFTMGNTENSCSTGILPYGSIYASKAPQPEHYIYPFPQQQFVKPSEFVHSLYPGYYGMPFAPLNCHFGYSHAVSPPTVQFPTLCSSFNQQCDYNSLYEYYSAKQYYPIQPDRTIMYIGQ